MRRHNMITWLPHWGNSIMIILNPLWAEWVIWMDYQMQTHSLSRIYILIPFLQIAACFEYTHQKKFMLLWPKCTSTSQPEQIPPPNLILFYFRQHAILFFVCDDIKIFSLMFSPQSSITIMQVSDVVLWLPQYLFSDI